MQEILLTAILKLDQWVRRNGWAGYDPYGLNDVIFSTLGQNKLAVFVSRVLGVEGQKIGFLHSRFCQRFLVRRRYEDPKTFAYFGKGYLLLYEVTGKQQYLQAAVECGRRFVEERPSDGTVGWGHPFTWYTSHVHYFHKNTTPNLYITGLVGHFLLDMFEATDDRAYLLPAGRAYKFFAELPYHEAHDGTICFWYIPEKRTLRVHNGNIYAASFLIRYGSMTTNHDSIELGKRALMYTIRHQNPDGSWYYIAPLESHWTKVIDNRHTGYVLDALMCCFDILHEEEIEQAIVKGGRFYESMFDRSGFPYVTPTLAYPQNIHDMAQGVQTFSLLSHLHKPYISVATRIALQALEHMQDPSGHFYYSRFKSGRTTKAPYMRWSQGPMFRALATLAWHLGPRKLLLQPGKEVEVD